MQRRILAVIALVVVSVTPLAMAACGGDGGDNKDAETPTAEASVAADVTPTATPHVDVPAGLPEIAVGAALLKDPIQLARLTLYQQVPCATNPSGGGAPPACRPEEADGTPVNVFPYSACEGEWVRPEQVPQLYRDALRDGTARILAAYKPKALVTLFGQGFGADLVVVMSTDTASPVAQASAFHIKDGRVAWLERGCNQSPATFVAPDRVDSFIVQPHDLPPS